MALVFPRDMTTGHEWEVAELELRFRQDISRQSNGVAIGKDLGSPIWVARFKSMPLEKNEADALYNDFLTLGGLARSFYLHPASRDGEENANPNISGTPIVSEIDPGRGALKISGLPFGFRILKHDYIGVQTSAGGLELLSCAEDVTVSLGTETRQFEIVGYMRQSIQVGDEVSLAPAFVEMRLDVDGLPPVQRVSGNLYTVSFSASQVIK